MTARQPLPVRTLTAEGERGRAGEGVNVPRPGAEFPPSLTPPLPPSAAARDAEVAGIWAALRDVMDPEFPISIVDLGLVYGVGRRGEVVEVDLTFTATACPCMDFIREDVRERLLREPGVADVAIRELWDPPWTRERITPEGRAILRRHGVAA